MITQRLSEPAVKVPPPVLQEDGYINTEYFGVLAAEKGPYITNKPPNFPHDHAADRIERCVKTQEIAQTVHDFTSLDLTRVAAYVGQQVVLHLIKMSAGTRRVVSVEVCCLMLPTKHNLPSQEKVMSVLPTIGFMNMPGPPGECGGTMVGKVRNPTIYRDRGRRRRRRRGRRRRV